MKTTRIFLMNTGKTTKPINQNYNAKNVDEGMIQRYVEEYLLYFIRPSIVVANADAPLLSPRTKSRT